MPHKSKARIEAENKMKEELLRREAARRFYVHFLPYVYKKSWSKTRMSAFLAKEAQSFVETDTGNAYDILVIMTPPQHGKSMTLTESLPCWFMMKHPEQRVILASYNEDSAERFSRRNREKFQEFGKQMFELELGGMNRANEFEIAGHAGRLISRGILSGITGNPANLLIIDDPIKNRSEADSPANRDRLWGEWLNSLKSRLAAKAKVIVIMTPWHEDDLAARILKTERNVRLIRLPVEAEPTDDAPDPLGRKAGEPLCPELGKDKRWLAQFKEAYLNDPSGGARAWAALYMCRPRIEVGNIIQRSWWRYYNPAEINQFGASYISVDAAFKDGESNDYVAIQVWGKRGNQFFMRHSVNKHLNFLATCKEIIQIRTAFPDVSRVLIEDKANGSAIIQTLQRQMAGVIGITPNGGKDSRVNAVSAAIESGNVFLPENAPWVPDFIEQCSAFPSGKHDDMVDAMSQALNYMLYANGAYMPPDETVQRTIAQSRKAIERIAGNIAYDTVYAGNSHASGYGPYEGYQDPYGAYGGIYGDIW